MEKTLEQLKIEYKNLQQKLEEISKQIEHKQSFVLMYINKSGKHTFVLQPRKQMFNLEQNGWKRFSKQNLTDFIAKYDL